MGFGDAPGGADNPLLEYLGIELVDVAPGRAAFRIELEQRHLNRQGSLQGGVAATLLDAACGYAGLASVEGDIKGNAVTVMVHEFGFADADIAQLHRAEAINCS
jgi:acyl-coenzyme A thioesterase PaaI-like protein